MANGTETQRLTEIHATIQSHPRLTQHLMRLVPNTHGAKSQDGQNWIAGCGTTILSYCLWIVILIIFGFAMSQCDSGGKKKSTRYSHPLPTTLPASLYKNQPSFPATAPTIPKPATPSARERMKSSLEAQRQQIIIMGKALDVKDAAIESLRPYVTTKAQIDDFNRKVAEYNSELDRYKALLRAYNDRVDHYNAGRYDK